MSLDVSLKSDGASGPERWAIFIREDGQTKEISLEEWNQRFPGKQPSLVHCGGNDEIYSGNITHNLGDMAEAAGIYMHMWRPEEIAISKAEQLIEPLTKGLKKLRANPGKYKKHDSPNGWGTYENFVRFVDEYLAACKSAPHATVSVWR